MQATRAKARGIRAARGGAEAEQESDLPSSASQVSSSKASGGGGSKGRPPEIAVGGDDALGGSGSGGGAGAGLPPAPPGPGTPGKKGLATMSAKLKVGACVNMHAPDDFFCLWLWNGPIEPTYYSHTHLHT